jgi:hypothetical protein
MSQDWKNDRAEGEMQAYDRANIQKHKEAKKLENETSQEIDKVKVNLSPTEGFTIFAVNKGDKEVIGSMGTLPTWFSGSNLVIDNETGKVINWVPIKLSDVVSEQMK